MNPRTFTGPAPKLTVGVIGAGVMGRGLAELTAACGHEVVLLDQRESVLAEARVQIGRRIKATRLMRPTSANSGEILGLIQFTTDYGALKRSEFVVENVSETVEAKQIVYRELCKACGPYTTFAANTSTIPIEEISKLALHPERVIGLHFMNPVSAKPIVEIVRWKGTSEETIVKAQRFLAAIGRSGIVVQDRPGFVSNRVLMLTINEAIRTVQEGTATAEDVDRIFVGCFGHAMGPLATADLIGLDTILLSLISLRDRLGDAKYEPTDLLKSMVDAQRLGRKVGRGFFDYLGHPV
jgi:3-hydroxybutyryl-CoA dehydrogenase